MQELVWFKFYVDFFDDKRTVYLMNLRDGHSIIIFFQMLMTLAAKCNSGGLIYFTKTIPYTPKLLSDVLRIDIKLVRRALKELKKLDYISETEDGFLTITDWSAEQYTPPQAKSEPKVDTETESEIKKAMREYNRNAKRRERTKKESEMSMTCQKDVIDMSMTREKNVNDMSLTNKPLYKDKDKDKDKEKEKEKDTEIEAEEEREALCARVTATYNTACASFPKIKILSDKQKQSVTDAVDSYGFEAVQLCFELAEQSDFLKGDNKKNWVATFDWLIDKDNMTKVLNGNYSERASPNNYETDPNLSVSFVSDEFIEAALSKGWG